MSPELSAPLTDHHHSPPTPHVTPSNNQRQPSQHSYSQHHLTPRAAAFNIKQISEYEMFANNKSVFCQIVKIILTLHLTNFVMCNSPAYPISTQYFEHYLL